MQAVARFDLQEQLVVRNNGAGPKRIASSSPWSTTVRLANGREQPLNGRCVLDEPPQRKEYDCESIDQQAERGFLLMVVSGSRHRFGFFGFGNVVSISSILAQEGGVVEEKH